MYKRQIGQHIIRANLCENMEGLARSITEESNIRGMVQGKESEREKKLLKKEETRMHVCPVRRKRHPELILVGL